jgi:hypothetical protein
MKTCFRWSFIAIVLLANFGCSKIVRFENDRVAQIQD